MGIVATRAKRLAWVSVLRDGCSGPPALPLFFLLMGPTDYSAINPVRIPCTNAPASRNSSIM